MDFGCEWGFMHESLSTNQNNQILSDSIQKFKIIFAPLGFLHLSNSIFLNILGQKLTP